MSKQQRITVGMACGTDTVTVIDAIVVSHADREEGMVTWATMVYGPRYERQYAIRGGHPCSTCREYASIRKLAGLDEIKDRPLSQLDIPGIYQGIERFNRHDARHAFDLLADHEEYILNVDNREMYRNAVRQAKRDLRKRGLKGSDFEAAMSAKRTQLKTEIGFVKVDRKSYGKQVQVATKSDPLLAACRKLV